MKPDAKPKPVNNIADLTKPMWIGLARKPQWRCLIPVTGFAEAEGEKGRMTRTWFSVKGDPVFAWGGLWRVSDEWGPVYSGAMADANEAVAPVHDRMPVLLHADEHEQWMHGSLDDLVAFQKREFPAALMLMERTNDLWVAKKPSAETPCFFNDKQRSSLSIRQVMSSITSFVSGTDPCRKRSRAAECVYDLATAQTSDCDNSGPS